MSNQYGQQYATQPPQYGTPVTQQYETTEAQVQHGQIQGEYSGPVTGFSIKEHSFCYCWMISMAFVFVAVSVVLMIVTDQGWRAAIYLPISVLFVIISFSFQHLEFADKGHYMEVRYGPCCLYNLCNGCCGTTQDIIYADMTAVELSTTTCADGVGPRFNVHEAVFSHSISCCTTAVVVHCQNDTARGCYGVPRKFGTGSSTNQVYNFLRAKLAQFRPEAASHAVPVGRY